MTKVVTGCSCKAFADARNYGFVREDATGFWLADLEQGSSGMGGYQRTYGPAIAFCPFCGTKLATAPRDASGPRG
ncbi:hypothetical protein [Polyangium jinanense]|uniref:Uncharacterized protein n=1 Tax=Polyangium jinanense TaxID=2829994 RepID=A0A9X3X6P3_9BACT|nr:hypothetical protein [Polyangium jinanense]MDC3958777.1 hypothetical protein [Polyangium jinanense]MDC3985242.1 hypothetical protein [Polyangium jinanense]